MAFGRHTRKAIPPRSNLPPVEPDAVEIRVLGCLIEKQRTTPAAYPLTLNSLRLACNQSTNRDPVVDYDESTIRAALDRLGPRGWTRMASWSGKRAMKYRHRLGDALSLPDPEVALLGVLMLRGAQTAAELKQRSERMASFDSPEDVERALEGLSDRELAARLPRRPGERGQRWVQLLGADAETDQDPAEASGEATLVEADATPDPEPDGDLGERVALLEREVTALGEQLRALREELGA